MLKNFDEARRINKVTLTDIADLLEVRYQTISDKVSGVSGFKFDEAFLVHQKFFSNYSFEWLFMSDELEERLEMCVNHAKQVS